MNQEKLTELVILAQADDAEAMEQLLFHIYTPVSYLCRKLLRNDQAADEEIREILSITAQKLNTLPDPEDFENWILRITASRCLQMLPQLRWGSELDYDSEPISDILGRELTPEQTSNAIQSILDTLPEDPRTCILLYACTGMHSRAISQISGMSQESVRTNLGRGMNLLQERLEEYQREGTLFSGITSLTEILRSAMWQGEDRDAALPVIYHVLGKEIPVPPDPTRWIVRVLTVIVILLALAVLGVGALLVMRILASYK